MVSSFREERGSEERRRSQRERKGGAKREREKNR